jgi:hypothetical protein
MRLIPSTVSAAVALVLAASAHAVWADVAGQAFIIDITLDTDVVIKGRLEFVPPPIVGDGLFGIDIENAGDITGTYTVTTELLGGLITRFEASGSAPDDGYDVVFSGTAMDIKQLFAGTFLEPFVADMPATISGSGELSTGETFTFEGEELFLVTTTTAADTPDDNSAAAPEAAAPEAAAPERSPRRSR